MSISSHRARPGWVFGQVVRGAVFTLAAALCFFPLSPLADDKAPKGEVKQTVEKAPEKAAKKATEKGTEKAVEKAAEKAVEKAAEKAAEEAAIKAEQKAQRPDEWRGPTKVDFFVFVLDVDDIDDANQNFTTNIFIALHWKDNRLASPEGAIRQMRLEEVWNPQVLITNRQGLVSRSLPEVVEVRSDGSVFYRQRYTGTLSQPLRLSEFPSDKHTFTIQFASAAYTPEELEFVPGVSPRGVKGGSIAKELSLQDWKILSYEVFSSPYAPVEPIRAPGFVFRFTAERYITYYIWQIVLPLTIVVAMSWAAFWVAHDDVGVRIGVATSSILTLIAQRFVFANLLPRLPYMTRMDYFTAGSTLLVFLALLLVVFSSLLAKQLRYQAKARKIDLGARFAFPVAFLALLLWFVWK